LSTNLSPFPANIDAIPIFNEALSRAKLHPFHILCRYTSLFYFHHLPTAIGPFPAYRLPPPLTTSSLDTYKTSILLSLGLLIPDDGDSTHL
jgi:hypothetical protein